MKKITIIFILLFCVASTLATAQKGNDFLIDPSKPYVYLEVDHVGARKPLRDGEPATGLWLHLKNNCKLSIVVIASRTPADRPDESLWVGDEVVSNKPSTGTESMGSGIGHQPGQDTLTDIFLSPNDNEAEVWGAEARALKGSGQRERSDRPHGYNNNHEPGAQVIKVIPSGGEISFSLPINHVSEAWHFEIPFRFALKHVPGIRQPYSYVALYWDDIPEADRSLILKAKESGSAKPAGTTEPEVEHSSSSPR